MVSDLPVKRVHDRKEQNDRGAARPAPSAADDVGTPDRKETEQRGDSERSDPTRSDVERLEAELEQKDQRLQRVVERYERLLDEKNQRLAKRDGSTTERSRVVALRSFLARLFQRGW